MRKYFLVGSAIICSVAAMFIYQEQKTQTRALETRTDATILKQLSATMQWQKLDDSGHFVGKLAGPWSCVADNQRKLVWEVKNLQETAGHYKSSYSWFIKFPTEAPKGIADRGSCVIGEVIEPCDTQDLIRIYNRESFCGVNGWRLPTSEELHTLLDRTAYPGRPFINIYLFPRTIRGPYWTSTVVNDNQVMTLDFHQGKSQALTPDKSAWLRLVSSMGEQP